MRKVRGFLTDPRLLTRGTEWYVMRGGRIAEVRAYYREAALGRSGLTDFPYGERGYFVPSE